MELVKSALHLKSQRSRADFENCVFLAEKSLVNGARTILTPNLL